MSTSASTPRPARSRVGRYVEGLVRDRLRDELESEYAAMARDQAREADAFDWAEATLEDLSDETR